MQRNDMIDDDLGLSVPKQIIGQKKAYTVDKQLGKGSFGTVYRGFDTQEKQYVAIKVLPRGLEDFAKYQRREIINHARLQHPQVIQFQEVVLDDRNVYVVMEYANKGNLYSYIIANKGPLSENEARWFFQQLIFGLEYLHKVVHIVNRDIKLENCLVHLQYTQFPVLKICDFGCSKCQFLDSPEKTSLGSPAYVAPEVILKGQDGKQYDGKKSDLWSCGVLLFVMLFGQFPFSRPEDLNSNQKVQMMLRRIVAGDWHTPTFPIVSQGAQELLNGLLQVDPEQRFTIEQIYDNSWFNEHLPKGVKQINKNARPHNPAQGMENLLKIIKEATQIDRQHSVI